MPFWSGSLRIAIPDFVHPSEKPPLKTYPVIKDRGPPKGGAEDFADEKVSLYKPQ